MDFLEKMTVYVARIVGRFIHPVIGLTASCIQVHPKILFPLVTSIQLGKFPFSLQVQQLPKRTTKQSP